MREGRTRLRLRVPAMPLRNGEFAVSVHVIDRSGDIVVWWHKNASLKVVGAYPGGVSDLSLSLSVRNEAS